MPLDHDPFRAEDPPKRRGRPPKGASDGAGAGETDSDGDSTTDDEE